MKEWPLEPKPAKLVVSKPKKGVSPTYKRPKESEIDSLHFSVFVPINPPESVTHAVNHIYT